MTTVFRLCLRGLNVADLSALEFEESRVRIYDQKSCHLLTCMRVRV